MGLQYEAKDQGWDSIDPGVGDAYGKVSDEHSGAYQNNNCRYENGD